LLGLAVGERRALVAEVYANGGGSNAPVVERAGEFVYPDGVTPLTNPESLGRSLAEFLRERGFSARTVVVGIPGKWLLTKRLEAPAAEPELVSETLRLQAEGEFAGDGGEFVYDYAGETSSSQARNVLLMAAPQKNLDQIEAMTNAARLKVVAVAPFAATLGAVAGRSSKDARMLLFGPGGAEFVATSGGAPRAIRYLGPSTSQAAYLAGEVRRASALLGNGRAASALRSSPINGAPQSEVHVWNDSGVAADSIESFGAALGSPVRLGSVRDMLGVTYNGTADAGRFAAPVALALAGMGSALPVDFLHSRLAPPRQVRFKRRTLIVAGVCAAIALLAGAAVWDLHSQQSQLDDYEAQLKTESKHVKVAQATVAKVSYAKPWGDTDPLTVACLSELGKALPEDGKVFLTSFNLNDTRKGSIAGRASGSEAALALQDKLQSSGRFADLHISSIESPRKPAGKQAPKPPEQPSQPPPQPPQMPAVMPTPPGTPGGGQPGVVVMSPTLAMVNGEPQANPAAIQMAMAKQAAGAEAAARAAAMAQAMGGAMPPGAMPPGAMPPGAAPPPTTPSGSSRKSRGGGPPGEGAPSGAGAASAASEVTFVMTFRYVPK
jgi:hypothetical protein